MKHKQKNKTKQDIYNTIKDSTFYGVKWDPPSLEVLKIVAQGLNNLTELFKSQNIEIKSLLTITNHQDDIKK